MLPDVGPPMPQQPMPSDDLARGFESARQTTDFRMLDHDEPEQIGEKRGCVLWLVPF